MDQSQPPCACPTPGYCHRYRQHMLGNQYHICNGHPAYVGATRDKFLAKLARSATLKSMKSTRSDRCHYLGARDGAIPAANCTSCNSKAGEIPLFKCHHPSHDLTTLEACRSCPDFTPREENPADGIHLGDMGPATWIPPQPCFCDSGGNTVEPPWKDAYETAFLIGGGPSLLGLDLTRLHKIEALTLGLNNVSELVWTDLWMCVDNPAKFPSAPFGDPYVTKILPRQHAATPAVSGGVVDDYPNVIYYRRNAWFRAERFLYENTFNWGCMKEISDGIGFKGGRTVMLPSLKVLYMLGIKRIILLGVDFNMSPDRPYAHSEDKDETGCRSNNLKFRAINDRLRALRPFLEREGVAVVNANPDSKLDAFDFTTYEAEIDRLGQARP